MITEQYSQTNAAVFSIAAVYIVDCLQTEINPVNTNFGLLAGYSYSGIHSIHSKVSQYI